MSNYAPLAKDAVRALPWHTNVPILLPTLAAVASLASLLLLVQMSGVAATGYDLRQLEEARSDWERNNFLLEAYIADLQSLDRIEHQARERLRMVPASDHVFLSVPVAPEGPGIADELPPTHVKRVAVKQQQTGLWGNGEADRLKAEQPARQQMGGSE